jgi:hypothetical protein
MMPRINSRRLLMVFSDSTITAVCVTGGDTAQASASAAAAAALGSAPAADKKPARSRKPSVSKPPAPVQLPPVADDPFELPSAAIKAKEAAVDSEVEKERVRRGNSSYVHSVGIRTPTTRPASIYPPVHPFSSPSCCTERSTPLGLQVREQNRAAAADAAARKERQKKAAEEKRRTAESRRKVKRSIERVRAGHGSAHCSRLLECPLESPLVTGLCLMGRRSSLGMLCRHVSILHRPPTLLRRPVSCHNNRSWQQRRQPPSSSRSRRRSRRRP